jgi:predicted nucleic acid-binding Zn ribbon protein
MNDYPRLLLTRDPLALQKHPSFSCPKPLRSALIQWATPPHIRARKKHTPPRKTASGDFFRNLTKRARQIACKPRNHTGKSILPLRKPHRVCSFTSKKEVSQRFSSYSISSDRLRIRGQASRIDTWRRSQRERSVYTSSSSSLPGSESACATARIGQPNLGRHRVSSAAC